MTRIRFRRGTAAQWTSANPVLTSGEPGFETDTGKFKIGDGSTVWSSLAYEAGGSVTESDLSLSDVTTDNVSISAHGFAPKAPNDSTKFLNGVGAYAVPSGTGAVASDTIWDAKGDLAVGTGADTASKLTVGTNDFVLTADSAQTTGVKWAAASSGVAIGGSMLVYRYTVTGSDKASIDTGVDTADAGSNDWTDGDVLEVFIIARTDDAAANHSGVMTLNNDTGANYEIQRITVGNGSLSGGVAVAQSNMAFPVHGSGGGASYPSSISLVIPGYAGTTFFKDINSIMATMDQTDANTNADQRCYGYRSTSAITRLKFAASGTGKFKVGTQLLIYKRKAS